jgi:uncharacterized protein
MEKDKVYKVTLQPMETSNYFAPGHQLRIEVSSSKLLSTRTISAST